MDYAKKVIYLTTYFKNLKKYLDKIDLLISIILNNIK